MHQSVAIGGNSIFLGETGRVASGIVGGADAAGGAVDADERVAFRSHAIAKAQTKAPEVSDQRKVKPRLAVYEPTPHLVANAAGRESPMAVCCTIFSVEASNPSEKRALDRSPALFLASAWNALHFSLGNHDGNHPLAFIAHGGEATAEGRYFGPDAVARIADAMADVSDDELARNFALRDEVDDPNSLYPSGFSPFVVREILHGAERLRDFLDDVSAAHRGIVVRRADN